MKPINFHDFGPDGEEEVEQFGLTRDFTHKHTHGYNEPNILAHIGIYCISEARAVTICRGRQGFRSSGSVLIGFGVRFPQVRWFACVA